MKRIILGVAIVVLVGVAAFAMYNRTDATARVQPVVPAATADVNPAGGACSGPCSATCDKSTCPGASAAMAQTASMNATGKPCACCPECTCGADCKCGPDGKCAPGCTCSGKCSPELMKKCQEACQAGACPKDCNPECLKKCQDACKGQAATCPKSCPKAKGSGV
jgi:hypothetical protein